MALTQEEREAAAARADRWPAGHGHCWLVMPGDDVDDAGDAALFLAETPTLVEHG